MNNEIEKSIIITLLNHQNLINTISANADWFVDSDLRSVFEALQKLDGTESDLMTIYGKAKMVNPNLNLTFRQLGNLQAQYITDANLHSDVQMLRKLAMQRDIDQAIVNYQKDPFDDTQEQLFEALSKIKSLGNEADTGQLTEQFQDLKDRLVHEQPSGIQSYSKLDKLLGGGLYGSMLLTIGARPSVGKTAFAVNLAYKMIELDPDVQIDFFTLEMNKREMFNRFVSRNTGISSQALRNPVKELNPVQTLLVNSGIDWFRDKHLFIYDQIPGIGGIINTIRRNAAKAKPHKYVAMIDYIGLISVPDIKDRYLQIGKITRDLKITSNEFDVPIIALTQLNRGIENRQDKTPQLSDIRESGSVEQDSNVVAFLHRPYDDRDLEQLIVQKNREGSLGKINFHFNGEEMLFQEL